MIVAESKNLQGELLLNEPMSAHTSWRVGGPARCFYRPQDQMDLAVFLQGLPSDESVMWLGLGSNVLVRDGGFQGVVIAVYGVMNEVSFVADNTLRAGAGASCAVVARQGARQGLTGLEFLAGIPGTMGGALAMNAGAFGGETWDRVKSVETIDRAGNLHTRLPDEYAVAYRSVRGPAQEWFVSVDLLLTPGDAEQASMRIKKLLEQRSSSQPTNQPSCGSVFRNPEHHHAAQLIDSAGMKGVCIGGACVSEKHANFIINCGNASALDIELLMHKIQQRVEQVHGICLMPEVHVVGDSCS
ncbi:MAG: UDP-N-acetylmuramate dehydrogenase [Gammaproteobacteria bacterium]|nr:UDP-N-acetylmuramate dehydrogenase [Gammaproteobacteria bacterium]